MVSTLIITLCLSASAYAQGGGKGGNDAPTIGKGGKTPFGTGTGVGGLVSGIAQSVMTSTGAVPFGPAPKGCSAYEILVGM
jgi:hypothetical protein